MNRHSNTIIPCPACIEKLKACDERLKSWFFDLKKEFQDAHISCGFRDEKAQNEAFQSGKSRLKWPKSAHNHTENGSPCSLAVDIFQLCNKKADFKVEFYEKIAIFNQKMGYPIAWGGNFKNFFDGPHFQVAIFKTDL